jgi:hypothetical protein
MKNFVATSVALLLTTTAVSAADLGMGFSAGGEIVSEYTFDAEEEHCHCLHGRVMVYDDELAEVGTWDGEKIEFLNATAAKFHRVRKLTSKND